MIRFILVPSTTDPQLTLINNAVYNQLFCFNLDVVITTLYFTLENTSIYQRIFKNVILDIEILLLSFRIVYRYTINVCSFELP